MKPLYEQDKELKKGTAAGWALGIAIIFALTGAIVSWSKPNAARPLSESGPAPAVTTTNDAAPTMAELRASLEAFKGRFDEIVGKSDQLVTLLAETLDLLGDNPDTRYQAHFVLRDLKKASESHKAAATLLETPQILPQEQRNPLGTARLYLGMAMSARDDAVQATLNFTDDFKPSRLGEAADHLAEANRYLATAKDRLRVAGDAYPAEN